MNKEIDTWVKRVNALVRKMDEECDGVHPTAWNKDRRDEIRRLAAPEGDGG